MKTITKLSKSHSLFPALLLIIMSFFLQSTEVYAGACSISGPGNKSGTVGTALSFGFTGSNNSAQSKMQVNFTWNPSTVPGISSTFYPAEGTAKSILYSFSGTPTTAGTYDYTATAHDNAGKCTDFSTTGSVTISAPPAVVIDTGAIPDGQEGVAYNKIVYASGGITPYNWTYSGYPAGLIFSVVSNNLVISGTPNAGTAGTYSTFVVTVTDSLARTATKTYAFTIAPVPPPLDIATITIPEGTVNIPYSYTMTGTAGTAPYTWASPGLPAGLSISSSGVISGTPTTAGTVNPTVTITDSVGGTKSKEYAFKINAAAAVVTSTMTDYCITPPFISPAPKPNLLLMIDNSASMYDMFYVDTGSATRTPYYCYDLTFNGTNSYPGYFDEATIYKYSTSNYRFEVSSFPAVCDKQVPSTGSAAHLCITGTNLNNTSTPKTVSAFYASGKYLNWLTASKFDVEKKILTGGKYDSGFQSLISESRGCVGRRYLKEAQTDNYVEGGANTSLGITFGVRGPIDPSNPSAPSPGGLTNIDIFVGDYDQGACQTAIDAYSDPTCGQLCRRDVTIACLKYDSHDTTQAGKTSNTYIQSVQECYQYDQYGTVGTDAKNTVKNQCPDVLDYYDPGHCSVTTTKVCTTDANCAAETPAGQRCMVGPYAITAGNAALLCGAAYTGACYVGSAPYSKFGYTGTVDGYTGDDCITYMHNKYCGDIKQPPVVDPTVEISATDFYENVPAILGDVGVQSQLGNPIKTLEVRMQNASPTGIIHDYKDRIRFGAISFDFNGSTAECKDTVLASDLVKCPKICSNDRSKTCMSYQDCPPASPAATCTLVTGGNLYKDPVTNQDSQNQDGARIISYIGDPTYAANPIGDHNSGLINALDSIRAQTWTPYAEGFYNAVAYFTQNTTDSTRPVRLNSGDFNTTTNPIQNSCQKNNILLISDGMSTTDQNSDVMSFVATPYNDGDGQYTTSASANGSVVPKYFGSTNIDDLAWYAWHKNIFNPSSTAAKKPKETIKTYVAYTGELCDPTSTNIYCNSCTTNDETKPERLMYDTALNGGGTCNFAKDLPALYLAISHILEDIAGAATSGTAASVLASGEGSGANLVQAVFYPTKTFNTDIKWIGRLTNLWYFVDPLFGTSGIYEDNSGTTGPPYNNPNDYMLDLTNDNRVSFAYDPVNKVTNAQRSKDTDGDGKADELIIPDIPFENMASLWDAGVELWKRSTARNIKTTIGSGLIDFSTANKATLMKYLRASDTTEAENIINYTHGTGDYGYRPRTVEVDLNKNGVYTDAGEAPARVWRLGDIIQSTPRIASRFALNSYDKVFNDTTYQEFIGASSPVSYRDRGMVFAGANDGMLHAFYLGKLELDGVAWKTNKYKKAKLADDLSVGRGKEVWAFIPSNVLPYLKYIADPNYCHIYSVDLSPYIFDASIGAPGSGDISNSLKDVNSWRTILIGGMRLGGACRASDASCTDCIKAPGVDLNEDGTLSGAAETQFGLSSYFALDITNTLQHPDNPAAYPPELLWEFSRPDLGFTTTGPSLVKINTSDKTKNGKWFVVFGSGPTGPVSTSDHQFMGRSDQPLTLFIIDLKNGPVSGSIWTLTTSETNGFAGSMINSTFDIDGDYQDDVVYVPYVKKTGTTWTDGGVGRLLTKEDVDPAHWSWSRVIDGIGPVTSAVAKLQDKRRGQLWLYFGTGRYYFEQETADDKEGQNAIYGIKDPCYGLLDPNFNLTSCPSVGSLVDVTDINNVPNTPALIAAMNGWKIKLNSCSDSSGIALGTDPSTDCSSPSVAYRTERMITDPLAVTLGVVFFTTFKPKDDNCNPGGQSYIWATKYNTGGSAGALLKGKAILQVSTGKIEEVNLSGQFAEEGERRTGGMEGVPPTAQGLSLITSPPPVKRTIHMMER